MSAELSKCCICLDQLYQETPLSSMKCAHFLHSDCVETWLDDHETCPVCREETKTSDLREIVAEASGGPDVVVSAIERDYRALRRNYKKVKADYSNMMNRALKAERNEAVARKKLKRMKKTVEEAEKETKTWQFECSKLYDTQASKSAGEHTADEEVAGPSQ